MRSAKRMLLGALALVMGAALSPATADVKGWLDWRGPQQNGTSLETGLPSKWVLGGANDLWHVDLRGGGTPVIANGKVYAFGYSGVGADLQEVLLCANAETGKVLWEKRFSDFLSDITYDRYAIGSPTVDPETGNVYVVTSAGIFVAFSGDGKPVFQQSLMENLGRLTFTNGRTGSPLIEDDMVVIRYVTSNWGGEGAASDRFYAFDKKNGNLIWSSTSGLAPKDNSFSRPWVHTFKGKRVMYAGIGDGSVVCFNARTGEPIWRIPLSAGGFNSSVTLHNNILVTIHGDENLDSSEIGRMTAINIDSVPKPVEGGGTPLLDKNAELWRNELGAVSSSPVIVGKRIYQINKTGYLNCIDVETGKIVWREKLGPDQLHASPTYADGKLYLPMQNGKFYIVKPTDTKAEILAEVQLAGRCIGAPSVYNGKVYVFSTEKLYCFGTKGNNPGLPKPVVAEKFKAGPAVSLQIIPAEVRLKPGEKATFKIRGIDANGFPTGWLNAKDAQWVKYIPPTARVKSEMNGSFSATGELVADAGNVPSAGAFQATLNGLKGTIRGRVMPGIPFTENFEEFKLMEPSPNEPDVKFAFPPLPWIGARFKFDVREVDGSRVFAKTLDNIFFQRAIVFFGHPESSNYTFEADLMSDGSRRTMGTVGVINQRYFITLLGNSQELQISSNEERIKVAVPFKWSSKEWYRMKTRVDVVADGSGVVRAKVWKRGEQEPEKWQIEVPHKNAHKEGAPGLFGFSPQSLYRVYIDNINVYPSK